MPLALLVDADQHRLEALRVERVQEVARRLQRNLVLGGFAAKDETDPDLAHRLLLPTVREGRQHARDRPAEGSRQILRGRQLCTDAALIAAGRDGR
ncbi:hypothetical protein [Xanthomonas sp. WHRI 8932A]|uniref:hypothetical protein n=1 Tax=unclassified Xanthomonas TaxID=2643310 RepID=UPI002B238333|nr:hypothetical protein [Xanthomonas sp. WHRI 8932A]MEA9566631.1 hypothetical protein [Xanthomonas sp. WHRI 8932A]